LTFWLLGVVLGSNYEWFDFLVEYMGVVLYCVSYLTFWLLPFFSLYLYNFFILFAFFYGSRLYDSMNQSIMIAGNLVMILITFFCLL